LLHILCCNQSIVIFAFFALHTHTRTRARARTHAHTPTPTRTRAHTHIHKHTHELVKQNFLLLLVKLGIECFLRNLTNYGARLPTRKTEVAHLPYSVHSFCPLANKRVGWLWLRQMAVIPGRIVAKKQSKVTYDSVGISVFVIFIMTLFVHNTDEHINCSERRVDYCVNITLTPS